MNILDWRNKKNLIESVTGFAESQLNNNLIDVLRERKVSNFWCDDLSWLPSNICIEKICDQFYNHYSHIKCFHGCRAYDIDTYFVNGLMVKNIETIEAVFKELFSDAKSERIEQSISLVRQMRNSESGKLYFVCDDSELIEGAGDYLIYGSEYLLLLTQKLEKLTEGHNWYVDRLTTEGVPTIFEGVIVKSGV